MSNHDLDNKVKNLKRGEAGLNNVLDTMQRMQLGEPTDKNIKNMIRKSCSDLKNGLLEAVDDIEETNNETQRTRGSSGGHQTPVPIEPEEINNREVTPRSSELRMHVVPFFAFVCCPLLTSLTLDVLHGRPTLFDSGCLARSVDTV